MYLIIGDDDLKPEFKKIPIDQINLKHLTAEARRMAMIAGKATFRRGNDVAVIEKLNDHIVIDDVGTWGPHASNNGGVRIYWSDNARGYFGEATVLLRKDGSVYVGDECSGPGFVEMLFLRLFDGAAVESAPSVPATVRYGGEKIQLAVDLAVGPGKYKVERWRDMRTATFDGKVLVEVKDQEAAVHYFSMEFDNDHFFRKESLTAIAKEEFPEVEP